VQWSWPTCKLPAAAPLLLVCRCPPARAHGRLAASPSKPAQSRRPPLDAACSPQVCHRGVLAGVEVPDQALLHILLQVSNMCDAWGTAGV
jgi:hypothetical protein